MSIALETRCPDKPGNVQSLFLNLDVRNPAREQDARRGVIRCGKAHPKFQYVLAPCMAERSWHVGECCAREALPKNSLCPNFGRGVPKMSTTKSSRKTNASLGNQILLWEGNNTSSTKKPEIFRRSGRSIPQDTAHIRLGKKKCIVPMCALPCSFRSETYSDNLFAREEKDGRKEPQTEQHVQSTLTKYPIDKQAQHG